MKHPRVPHRGPHIHHPRRSSEANKGKSLAKIWKRTWPKGQYLTLVWIGDGHQPRQRGGTNRWNVATEVIREPVWNDRIELKFEQDLRVVDHAEAFREVDGTEEGKFQFLAIGGGRDVVGYGGENSFTGEAGRSPCRDEENRLVLDVHRNKAVTASPSRPTSFGKAGTMEIGLKLESFGEFPALSIESRYRGVFPGAGY